MTKSTPENLGRAITEIVRKTGFNLKDFLSLANSSREADTKAAFKIFQEAKEESKEKDS